MNIIPDWNGQGIIPPIRPGVEATDLDRSPYRASTVTLVERFGTSKERITLLEGFLRYRQELEQAGIVTGFHWINGSFAENKSAPQDIDCITFLEIPPQVLTSGIISSPIFSDEVWTKNNFGIHNKYIELGKPLSSFHVEYIAYWYSLWSHRRDFLWKGFVQVPIDTRFDAQAFDLLQSLKGESNEQS